MMTSTPVKIGTLPTMAGINAQRHPMTVTTQRIMRPKGVSPMSTLRTNTTANTRRAPHDTSVMAQRANWSVPVPYPSSMVRL